MSDFFEPPPPPRTVIELRPPEEWDEPPPGAFPAVVPVERVIARGDGVAALLDSLWVFPTGIELELVVVAEDEDAEVDPFAIELDLEAQRTGEIPPGKLRLGLELADGSRATNIRDWGLRPPGQPVLRETHGLRQPGECVQSFWIWPLPPPGRLALVCEWPAAGIPLTHVELDAGAIAEAASRAAQRRVW